MPEASANEQNAREAAREKAWHGLNAAIKELLRCERMSRVKVDYSLYGEEVDGTVELVRVAKRRPKNG